MLTISPWLRSVRFKGNMDTREQLCRDIRAAFGQVPFPEHCGLRAAMAMDDCISDPDVLRQITTDDDIRGEWWEIPPQELRTCSLGISYLDAAGVEFYLPAYLMLALDDFTYPDYRSVVETLDPQSAAGDAKLREYFTDRFSRNRYERALHFLSPPYDSDDNDDDLREHYQSTMSRISGDKRDVCVRFLEFLHSAFDPTNTPSPYVTVNKHLRSEADRIHEILRHEFWSSDR